MDYNTYIPPKSITQPLAATGKESEAKKVAQEFESMFIAEMLRPMAESDEINPLFGGGQAEKYYRSMLVDEYGKEMAKAGGIGVAANVEKELLKLQEVK